MLQTGLQLQATCLAVLVFNFILSPRLVSSSIFVMDTNGTEIGSVDDVPAQFGMTAPEVMYGAFQHSDPNNFGCLKNSIYPAPSLPPFNDTRLSWFLVVMRGNCTFAQKALNAQRAGYSAIIVRNEERKPNRGSFVCDPGTFQCNNITIYVSLVSFEDGFDLARIYNAAENYTAAIRGEPPVSYLYYVLPFLVVVAIVLLVICVFFCIRFVRECIQARKLRLSRWALRKIPTRKFRKGTDHYDCCSICLDDFVDGDKLRILPCDHAYHVKCIDPWLLNNRRNCPVCKRKVRIPGEVYSDSDDESTEPGQSASGQQVSRPSEQPRSLPIGEGVQLDRSLSNNDEAPLVVQRPSRIMCCIPIAAASSESIPGAVEASTSAATVESYREADNDTDATQVEEDSDGENHNISRVPEPCVTSDNNDSDSESSSHHEIEQNNVVVQIVSNSLEGAHNNDDIIADEQEDGDDLNNHPAAV